MTKILVIGYGRHGKDTVSEYLRDAYGLGFKSSSMHCAESAVYPVLSKLYGYKTVEECYADRANHRAEWFNLISDYCKEDAARIGREIFSVSDIYCGLRNSREYYAIRDQRLYDFCIWVDRSEHLPPESKDSMDLEPWMADFVVDNNTTLDQLYANVDQLMSKLGVYTTEKV